MLVDHMHGRRVRLDITRQGAIRLGQQTDAVALDPKVFYHLALCGVLGFNGVLYVKGHQEQLGVGDGCVVAGVDAAAVPLILRLKQCKWYKMSVRTSSMCAYRV